MCTPPPPRKLSFSIIKFFWFLTLLKVFRHTFSVLQAFLILSLVKVYWRVVSYFLGVTSISDSFACKGLLAWSVFCFFYMILKWFAFSILLSFSLPFSVKAFSIGSPLLFPSKLIENYYKNNFETLEKVCFCIKKKVVLIKKLPVLNKKVVLITEKEALH